MTPVDTPEHSHWLLLRRLATETDERLDEPWDWPGAERLELQRRYAYLRVLELEQEAAARAALLAAPNEASAIASLAGVAFGDFPGLLAGLEDADLDLPPAGGGWTVRELLVHVLLIERRYRLQAVHAAQRADSDPLLIRAPETLQAGEDEGGIGQWLERLRAERALLDRAAAAIPDEALTRPTQWVLHDVDVRFRLHRFAAHLSEHAVHLGKVLVAIGRPPGEAAQHCVRIARVRGLHEMRTSPADLARLHAAEAAIVAALDA